MNRVVFTVVILLCGGYALRRGGAPERLGIAIIFIGSAATAFAISDPSVVMRSLATAVLVIDLATLAAFLALALKADRFWPLWVTGFQGVGVIAHIARLLDPAIISWAYAVLLSVWAYPMLVMIAVASRFHHRRLTLNGADPSWSISSRPS